MALAHPVGDSVEGAYRHSTRLNKKACNDERLVKFCARRLLASVVLLPQIGFLDWRG